MNSAPVPAYTFGDVTVATSSQIFTPAGSSWLSETQLELGSPTAITGSTPTWNPFMVVVSIVVAFFTCGLGLLLLFLSRSVRIDTIVMDTVTLKAPGYYYVAQGIGGAQFISWVGTWRQQLAAHELSQSGLGTAGTSIGQAQIQPAISGDAAAPSYPTKVFTTETEVIPGDAQAFQDFTEAAATETEVIIDDLK